MTERKPPNMTWPGWVEHQVRTAEAAGAFDDLPGKGKPIPGLDRPQDDLAWIANYLRRENVDVAALLPPALALAKEVEVLPERLVTEHSEHRVRAIVDDLNDRIVTAHRLPQSGPPMRVGRVDLEAVVGRWRSDRAALVAARASAREPVSRSSEPTRRARPRRWRVFGALARCIAPTGREGTNRRGADGDRVGVTRPRDGGGRGV